MPGSIYDFLQPQVILDVVSRLKRGQGRLGRWLGLHYTGMDEDNFTLTGPSLEESPVRSGTYHIFDRTRTVMQMRAPGTGPGEWQPQPIGEVNYTIARFHEKIRFNIEELSQLSPVVGPNTQLDPRGQDYVTRQEGYLAQRANNAVELMIAGLIRGKLYMVNAGETWIPQLSLPTAPPAFVTIDYKIPSGNTAQLNMLGAGSIIGTSWDNVAAPIISNDLPKISEAYAQLTGMALTDAWCNPTTWGALIKNTEIINTAGSANQPFEMFQYSNEGAVGGAGTASPYPEWVAVLRGMPTIRWHILSEYLIDAGGTDPTYAAGTGPLTSVIPAKTVLFTPPPDPEWIDGMWYGEYVSEQPGQPAVRRPAWWFWHEWKTQPTTLELVGLMNVLPRLRIPKSLLVAQVIFP